jgi:CRP/FNR family transcriptional regulator
MTAMAFDLTPITLECSRTAQRIGECMQCPARSFCLIGGLASAEVAHWNDMLQPQATFVAGAQLYAAGQPARTVFMVRAGCIKTFTVDEQGNERVRGFHLAGDIVGMDSLSGDSYLASAVAVTPAQVCRAPRVKLLALLKSSPELSQRLVERLSHTLGAALALSGDYTADQRIAAFLVTMRQRLNPLPGAPTRLPMCRRDIANFLRLATETVCRVLTRFERQGLIQVSDRAIRMLKPGALLELAEPVGISWAALPLAA